MTDTKYMANANIDAVRAFRAGRPFIHTAGSGLVCPLIRTLCRYGRVSVRRTGTATVYTLRSR